ncbi:MAG: recombinase family protein, partial [Chloroflexi bacterium]|nr:recombinase family protein [Chloroflexota bacterium]
VQVQENTGSTARQYDLTKRALNLGWPQERIEVIDQDQGHSGSSINGRDGFQYLMAQVGLGKAGAVVSIEVSRLARSCTDWYRLLEICALSSTLVIDEEGVYDPSQYNDRLLLGFKGTMSEAELHWLTQRMQGGKLAKAEKGELRCLLPVGLIYDSVGTNRIVLDPDEEVQQAVRLVFELFAHSGSALAVAQHFEQSGLKFPTRQWEAVHQGEVVWRPLSYTRVLNILHNPTYAGAYVYGQVHYRTKVEVGDKPTLKGHRERRKLEDWPIILEGHHPGYVTWDVFVGNQKKLADNRTYDPSQAGGAGAVHKGEALLSGIVRCGRCGRKMKVHYQKEGSFCYQCEDRDGSSGSLFKLCQDVRGSRIDQAVASAVLEAIEPAELNVALGTLAQLEEESRQFERQWQRRIERSQYEADLARRRFVLVDPENRLVARNLEKEWNLKLAEIVSIEREYAEVSRDKAKIAVSASEREAILSLSHDLPQLWQAQSTTNAERKQLLRYLIADVTLLKEKEVETIRIVVRWQSGAVSELKIARIPTGRKHRPLNPEALKRMLELSATHSSGEIAEQLNGEGYQTSTGRAFSGSNVRMLLEQEQGSGKSESTRKVVLEKGQRGDGRYGVAAAARVLKVSEATVRRWCEEGRLEVVRNKPSGPRWIALNVEVLEATEELAGSVE